MHHKLNSASEEFHAREKDLNVAIDQSRKNEAKLAEKLKNLENVLDHGNQVNTFNNFFIEL